MRHTSCTSGRMTLFFFILSLIVALVCVTISTSANRLDRSREGTPGASTLVQTSQERSSRREYRRERLSTRPPPQPNSAEAKKPGQKSKVFAKDYDSRMRIKHEADEIEMADDKQQEHFKRIGWIEEDDVFTPFTRFLRPPVNLWQRRKVASRRYLQNPENLDVLEYAQRMERLGESIHRKNKELRRKTFEELKRLNQSYPSRKDGPEIVVWLPQHWRRGDQQRLFKGKEAEWLREKCPVKCRPTKTEWGKAHILFHIGKVASASHGWPVPNVKPWQKRAMVSLEPHVLDFSPPELIDILLHFDYFADMPRRYGMCLGLRGDRARFREPPPFESQSSVSAATFVTNCGTPRTRFMRKLGEEAGVNLLHYGSCLHTHDFPCQDRKYDCKLHKTREHRFSFGVESRLVGQYASEKLGHMMCHSGVNVYYGSPGGISNYGFPIIEAMDYYSEKELAAYLNEVARNRTLYEYYTKRPPVFHDPWVDYRLEGAFARVVCSACLAYVEKGYHFKAT